MVALLLQFYFVFLSFGFVLFSLYVCILVRSFLKLSFCQINGNCEIFVGEDQKRKVDGKGDFRIHTDKKRAIIVTLLGIVTHFAGLNVRTLV